MIQTVPEAFYVRILKPQLSLLWKHGLVFSEVNVAVGSSLYLWWIQNFSVLGVSGANSAIVSKISKCFPDKM